MLVVDGWGNLVLVPLQGYKLVVSAGELRDLLLESGELVEIGLDTIL